MPEDIGGVSISITGDYSQLERDFDAATAAATQAGNEIASAFTGAVRGTEALTGATTEASQAFSLAENASRELSTALQSAASQSTDFETRIQALVDKGFTLAQALEQDATAQENFMQWTDRATGSAAAEGQALAALGASAEAAGQDLTGAFTAAAASGDRLQETVGALKSEFETARGPIAQMGAAAQELVATQGRLDQELETAKQALSEIRTAYESGSVSASTLARAEQELERATVAANIPLREVPAALANFSDAARDVIQEQAKLDQELVTAKRALEEIKTAYEAGAVGAQTLARAEAEVDAATKKANVGLGETKSTLQGVTEGLQTFAQGMSGNVTGALEATGLASEGLVASLAALASAAVAAAAALYELLVVAQDFESANYKLVAATGASGEELARLEGAFHQVFVAANETAEEIGSAMGILEARLHPTTEALVSLSKTLLDLHDITGEQINPLVTESARLFRQWQIATEDQTSTLDHLLRVSQATGASVGQLESILVRQGSTFRDLGLSAEQAAEFIGKVEQSGYNTQQVMGSLDRAMKELAKAGVGDLRIGFDMMLESIRNADSQGQALEITTKGMGKASKDLVEIIRDANRNFFDFNDRLHLSNETISEQAERIAKLSQKWENLLNQIKDLAAPVANLILTVAKVTVDAIESEIHVLEALWAVAHFEFSKAKDKWEESVASSRKMIADMTGDVGKLEKANPGAAFAGLPDDIQKAVLRTSGLTSAVNDSAAAANQAREAFDKWLAKALGEKPEKPEREHHGRKGHLPMQGPEPPEGLEEINRQLLELSQEAPRLAEKAATLTNKALSALGAPIVLVDLQKAGEAIKELMNIEPGVKLFSESELKLRDAFKRLGLSADDAAGTIKNKFVTAFDDVAKNEALFADGDAAALLRVQASWAAASQGIQRLAKYDLPAAIDEYQKYIDLLIKAKAPLGDIYAAQEKELQLEIRMAEERGRSADAQIIQLTNIRLKHEALADSVNSLGRIYAGLAKTFHDAFDKMSRAIADNIVEGKNWGEVFTGVVKEIEKEILNVLIGEVFKKLRSVIIGTGDDLTGLGKIADTIFGKLGGIFGGSKGGGGLPGIDTPDMWGGGGGIDLGGLPGVGDQPGIDLGRIGNPDATSGIGGAVGSAVGGAVTSVVGAVAGVVSAISGVVGNFQFAHMNTALGRIEESTRKTWIVTGEQPDSILWSSKETALWSDRIHGQLDTIRQNTWAMLMDLDRMLQGGFGGGGGQAAPGPSSQAPSTAEQTSIPASEGVTRLPGTPEPTPLLPVAPPVTLEPIRLPATPEPTLLNPNAISGPQPINILLPPFPQLNELPPAPPEIASLLTPEQIDKLNVGLEKLNEPPQPPPNIYGMLTADDLDRLSLFQPQLIEPPSAPEELNEPPQAPPIYGLLTPSDLERLGIKQPELGEPPAEPMYEVPPATFIPDAIDTVGTEITDSLDVIPEAIGNLGRDISARLETIPRELTSINQEVSSDLSSLAQAVSAKPPMVVRLEQTPTVVAIPGKTPEPHPVSVPTGVPSETTPAAVDLSKGLPERLEDIATILRGIADQLTGIGASLVTGFKEITDKTEGLGERILTGLASGVMGAINAARTAGAAKPSGAGAGDVIGDVVGETISGVVGAVAGVASAISSVIGNFQMAHMNTALGRIEESTRKSWIITGEQADSVWWSTKATALNTDAALGHLDTIRQNTWAILMDLDRMASLSSLSMNVNTSAMSVPVLPFIDGEATSIVGGDTTINAPITVNGAIDPRETAKQVAEHLKLVSSKMAFGSA